jgi:PTH1 family peptidyl-tRNA hydrolase
MKTSNSAIKAIIGLGNPGREYENTYHNIGRMFVEYYLKQEKDDALTSFLRPSKKDFEYCQLSDKILLQLETFMNSSGPAVRQAVLYFKLKTEEIMIVHDDSDMTIGNYKIVFDQRSAGHRGVQSIIDTLKIQKFWRLKIGIRPTQEVVRQKAEKFVLKKMSKKDADIFHSVFEKIILELKK